MKNFYTLHTVTYGVVIRANTLEEAQEKLDHATGFDEATLNGDSKFIEGDLFDEIDNGDGSHNGIAFAMLSAETDLVSTEQKTGDFSEFVWKGLIAEAEKSEVTK